jgi:hypothetical protein
MKKLSGSMKVTGLVVVTAVVVVAATGSDRDAATRRVPAKTDPERSARDDETFNDWDDERLDAEIVALDALIKSKAITLRLNDGRVTDEERAEATVLFQRLLALRSAKLDRQLVGLEQRAFWHKNR